jgi:hypothetical protein
VSLDQMALATWDTAKDSLGLDRLRGDEQIYDGENIQRTISRYGIKKQLWANMIRRERIVLLWSRAIYSAAAIMFCGYFFLFLSYFFLSFFYTLL